MTTINVSMDIETLSTHKNAMILSIAAVAMHDEKFEPFVFKLNLEEQINLHRHISNSTVEFWTKQNAELFQDQFLTPQHPVLVISEFAAWLDMLRGDIPFDDSGKNKIVVWTNGPSFDGAIFESLCEDFNMNCPVGYGDWRDVRTMKHLVGDRLPKVSNDVPHDPVHDARAQATLVLECAKILGVDLTK